MENSSGTKVWVGLGWSAFERGVHAFGMFVVQIILARILAPSDFGIVGIALAIIAICNIFIDAGLGNSIIQKKQLPGVDISTLAITNIVFGGCVSLIVWSLAPGLATVYAQPELEGVLRSLSVVPIIGSFGVVPHALLLRSMRYRTIMMVNVPGVIISGLVGIYCATIGYGIWALVIQIIAMNLVKSVLATWWCGGGGWQGFKFSALRRHFPFGSNLLLANFINEVFNNIYALIIGYSFTPVEVGFFHRAKSIQQLPVKNITQVIGRVYFPLMSKRQDDPKELGSLFLDSVRIGVYSIIPLMTLVMASSPVMVPLLLGPKWLPVTDYLVPICLIGVIYPLHTANMNILLSVGRADVLLKLEFFKKSLVIINILITLPMGVMQMLYGMVLVSLVNLATNIIYARKYSDSGIMRHWEEISRILVFSVCGGLVLVKILGLPGDLGWKQLVLANLGGGGVLVGLLLIFERSKLRDIFDSVRSAKATNSPTLAS
jgi:teichuronic acid exporter